ncbi:MAG: hypothetical protein AAF391_11305, partial [Bacteroidota bacterium]
MFKKTLPGRGRKREEWVVFLHQSLLEHFERLRAAGVKFNINTLQLEAKALVMNAPDDSGYHHSVASRGSSIISKIAYRWIRHFMSANRIVLRCQTGKLLLSPSKQEFIERKVAFHLGLLKRGFESGTFREDSVENADETHFVVNMDNGKTLGFIGDRHVKYADVVSGGDSMTMMVRLTGGVSAMICPPMIIFSNANRSYPIRGVEDSVPGVCYRSSPKGWMDSDTWISWLQEPRAISALPGGVERTLFVDNCSSHILDGNSEAALKKIRTRLLKLPPNSTDLTQPADSFIIQKIKEVWRRLWDEYKLQCINEGQWQDGVDGQGSGRLPNPGKRFFLKLAADSVREVNGMRDANGLSYARKAMIMTGMSLSVNGTWSESQLT